MHRLASRHSDAAFTAGVGGISTAAARLLEVAESFAGDKREMREEDEAWRDAPVGERLSLQGIAPSLTTGGREGPRSCALSMDSLLFWNWLHPGQTEVSPQISAAFSPMICRFSESLRKGSPSWTSLSSWSRVGHLCLSL